MKHVETIIVGGGPAGSTCGWHLTRHGREALILDKSPFPRLKLCAGWISEKVMTDLEFDETTYPHQILKLDIRTHIRGLPFSFRGLPTPGANYSIRRTEFDDWLLQRSNTPFVEHNVKKIRRDGDLYVIDEQYSCRYLIGAGGTMCPVRRVMFPGKRTKRRQIATLEKEFKYPARNDTCHLYFLYRRLLGYSWFVPKGNGFVNIGIGGKSHYFKKSGTNIHDHFRLFLGDLVTQKLLDRDTAENLKDTGHPYFLFTWKGEIKDGNCFLIGDSAGLASVDMGEGIGPAIESGLLTAREIMGEGQYTKDAITKYSFSGIAQSLMHLIGGKRHTVPPA
ncbi:MAG: NAD(P)/FAD-dependent oxidoreductase [Fimbriimonadaceae bacterium]|nr:NAD(P)/FAD-dependent oxidoreductase [Alphaproteobacteria bacterium]